MNSCSVVCDKQYICVNCYNFTCEKHYNEKNEMCSNCDINKLLCVLCSKRIYNKDLSYWYRGRKIKNECVLCDKLYCKHHLLVCDHCGQNICINCIMIDKVIYEGPGNYPLTGNFCNYCFENNRYV